MKKIPRWGWIVIGVFILFVVIGLLILRGCSSKPAPEQMVSDAVTTPNIVYILNKSVRFTIKVCEVEGSKSLPAFVRSKHIKPFDYQGHDGIMLQAKILESNGKVIFKTPVEDFSGGTWVWIFDGNGVKKTQDLSALPVPPPSAKKTQDMSALPAALPPPTF